MLPDVLTLPDGRRAVDPTTWREVFRPALIELLASHIYGHAPSAPAIIAERQASGELERGVWEHWRIRVWPDVRPLSVLLCLPHGDRPAPCYVGFNFHGNHSLLDTKELPLPGGTGAYGEPQEADRGRAGPDWCLKGMLRRGWGLCTAYYGELEPDRSDGPALSRIWRDGGFAPDAGAISAWAWLLSRLVDLLMKDRRVDASRLVAVGHSRLGKTALLATARDPRLAMAVANGSGCGGAGSFREPSPGAETLAQILRFTHWFHPQLGPDPQAQPLDMHHLLACIAPRPVLLTNAEDDDWADQRGQLRTLQAAAPAWRLLGSGATPPAVMPALGSGPDGTVLRYAYRVGPHCLCPADWSAIFAATAADLPG